jgi:hypothetical protein
LGLRKIDVERDGFLDTKDGAVKNEAFESQGLPAYFSSGDKFRVAADYCLPQGFDCLLIMYCSRT